MTASCVLILNSDHAVITRDSDHESHCARAPAWTASSDRCDLPLISPSLTVPPSLWASGGIPGCAAFQDGGTWLVDGGTWLALPDSTPSPSCLRLPPYAYIRVQRIQRSGITSRNWKQFYSFSSSVSFITHESIRVQWIQGSPWKRLSSAVSVP